LLSRIGAADSSTEHIVAEARQGDPKQRASFLTWPYTSACLCHTGSVSTLWHLDHPVRRMCIGLLLSKPYRIGYATALGMDKAAGRPPLAQRELLPLDNTTKLDTLSLTVVLTGHQKHHDKTLFETTFNEINPPQKRGVHATPHCCRLHIIMDVCCCDHSSPWVAHRLAQHWHRVANIVTTTFTNGIG
jgi:hypothetical protein